MAAGDPLGEWAFLAPRVAVAAPFPPAPDGIGRYAEQQADALAGSRTLTRIGIAGGGGGQSLDVRGGLRPLRLWRASRSSDELLIHYHPHYFVADGLGGGRIAGYLALALLARLRRLAVVVHEADEPRPEPLGRRGAVQFAIEEVLRRSLWSHARTLVFHSDGERDRFRARFPAGRRSADRIVGHGAFFRPAVDLDRPAAREQLGLGPDRIVLLMIGFISATNPDKGYDRAIAAIDALGDERVELHLVGSAIRPWADVEELIARLHEHAARSRQIHFHEGFVDDAAFDLWVRAADAVLTPYRSGTSSGVAARARLLGTRLVTSDAGGLAEQAGPSDIVVRDDDELLAALRRVVAEAG